MTIVKKAFLGLIKKLSEEYLWGNIELFIKGEVISLYIGSINHMNSLRNIEILIK